MERTSSKDEIIVRLSISFALFFCTVFAHASILHVGRGQPYAKIREAIGIAKEADTVFIHDGVYKEGNIVFNKSLHLMGEKGAILDGENKFEILTVSARKFSISGLTFRNSGYSSMNDFASIKIIDATEFRIENNTIINASFGIHVSNCNYFQIQGNTISGSPREEQNTGNGIHLWKCSRANIFNNRVSGHRDGIYFEFVTFSNIIYNHSEKNIRYGLHFMFSNDDAYRFNTFIGNGAGVAVMFSHHVDMSNNRFERNKGSSSYGILLKEISDGNIINNVFIDNTVGVFMEGTNRIKVNGNSFSSNGWGFRIQASCSDITIEKNNFTGNTFDVATNGTLVLNTFTNNYWDKYEGYDLNKDGIGDIPYHPSSLFSTIAEDMPYTMMLYRSFTVMLMERTEKAIPAVTPENLVDRLPSMKPQL